jgi:hypothetical protein
LLRNMQCLYIVLFLIAYCSIMHKYLFSCVNMQHISYVASRSYILSNDWLTIDWLVARKKNSERKCCGPVLAKKNTAYCAHQTCISKRAMPRHFLCSIYAVRIVNGSLIIHVSRLFRGVHPNKSSLFWNESKTKRNEK